MKSYQGTLWRQDRKEVPRGEPHTWSTFPLWGFPIPKVKAAAERLGEVTGLSGLKEKN